MRTQDSGHLPFALLLPGLQLLVALLAITPELMVGLESQHRPQAVTSGTNALSGDLDPNAIINITNQMPKKIFPDRVHAVSILNMPGMLGEIAISLPTTWPQSWYPRSLFFADPWTWRALSWAIYTLPLWWMSGRALDAIRLRQSLTAPPIRFVEMVIMMIMGMLTLFIGVGLFFAGNGQEDDQATLRWMWIPGLMWFGFGVCSLVAWRRQGRTRRAFAVREV